MYHSAFRPSNATKPAAPKTETVRDLCIAAGVPDPGTGRIPIRALDARLKILGWDVDRRMVWKDKARRLGMID